jgi:hypothetical protein
MSRLRQDDRERAVGMVQAGLTQQAVADHFNVSKVTNDRPRNDRPHVTSQRQDGHVHLIHLRNRMIMAEDTPRRSPGLANVRILGPTVRKKLRE